MVAVLAWIGTAAFCQEKEPKHAIDVWLEKELAKNPSTAGQRHATIAAQKRWDAEMNRAYKRLLSKLDSRRKSALITAQRAWISYRDAEFELINKLYMKKQGTIYRPMHDSDCMEVVRKRALQLDEYVTLLDE